MAKLENFILGRWITGDGEGQPLFNAVTGEQIATASTKGIDFKDILQYARTTGNPALRNMSFHERGLMLKNLALHLRNHLDKFYQISYQTGATKADSWVDIEGGIGNLFSYASLRRKFPDEPYCLDGEHHVLGKANTFMGHHLLVPKEGVAVHINAFNFPVWGMLEKIAVNLLAGMPAVVKPATVTSFLTEAVVREIIASGILPQGALQLVCGSAGDMLQHVTDQDVVTFTGSASTGLMLKSTPSILSQNVPFTMEADSLNCIVLGKDVTPDMPEWDIFLKEVRKEITTKCGQKCTAIRRIFVPADKIEDVQIALGKYLSQTTIGNPLNDKVRMGSLAGELQRVEVKAQVQKLLASSQLIYGSLDSVQVIDADAEKGAFMSPLLLLNENPFQSKEVHEIEAFGPVSTLMPYDHVEDAIQLAKMGKGSLVSSIVTADKNIAKSYVLGAGMYHGRILVLNSDCAKESTGHGSPLPLLVHGGPGRAGGGEEMGGIRGVKHYMQRVAIQGSPDMITAISNIYQPGAKGNIGDVHPFKKYFDELQIGDQLLTEKRLITAEDIDQFADLSGDHFYAHLRDTDFSGTMFERQVAHGYLIMSIAAGLFVSSYDKNPVLLNYGIDELRFTKPVYPGSEIQVRFTCKEKTRQEKKEPTDIDKGIVKWLVEIMDETGEITGVATILTMVERKS
ncbi:MAG: phenylacetic acid degradation bifunctional protein PaaZ [Sediminibacterium sp. Gen4]|jgi:oxepin-CoA hydrolase / 3-oxo-5,6-dehydrosuberyl-CoA semialdehyde dehydrogenase|uniref:phenylacetic acid degradation bifunctional protein PaaZ n=1 Tax=unclassified Sediminibacterium TaxID=2635961 RepID=UPI0015B7FF51|nr:MULTISPECIES: phenylacetic acid degradation bifunctional protein PaaZ [unclassified Sediminibacterium]MBW0160400.1 phenylacetic acid degradation bifunctional protein PaaZ [Sediminibacterium sp.]MBW0163691.1 phenylacetic acid degradation bifunctional protein PaaZ [Sediminibacterium sp.]NWK67075.1 phenylacetic acid degradation bifunctional protein PaaZ [Sediminibacterium sp. Gen4]